MRIVTSALSAFAIAATLAGSVKADPVTPEVRHQLERIVLQNQHTHRVMVHDMTTLRRGGDAIMPVSLAAGAAYLFAARCDNDCLDVDLVLEDEHGREIKADRDNDDTPMFAFRAQASGRYRLRVELADCSTRDCNVGVLVMRRYGTPTDGHLRPVR